MFIGNYIHIRCGKPWLVSVGKGLQNTVDGLMKIGPVLSETDGLGVQNTAVACGAYSSIMVKRSSSGESYCTSDWSRRFRYSWKKGKSSSSACSWKASLKTPQDRFLEMKPRRSLSVSSLSRILSTRKCNCAVKPVTCACSSASQVPGRKAPLLYVRSACFECHIYL